MADEETPDPSAAFAALMSKAAESAAPAASEPWLNADGSPKYGTHPDGSPKKAAGRPRKSPSLDELKAAKTEAEAASSPAAGPPADRAPDPGRKGGRGKAPGTSADVPQHRPGLITKGMNKRYRQLGKAVRALDKDIGQAFIEAARNTADPPAEGQEPEDNSVGAAWDDVARTNPRIRKFCLMVIQGGAVGALVLAHAPIGVAVALKFVGANPGFIGRLILSMAEPDEDTPEGEGGLPFGLTGDDAKQVMSQAGKLFPGMVPEDITPAQLDEAMATLGQPQNGRPPPGRPRNQQFARHGQGKRR